MHQCHHKSKVDDLVDIDFFHDKLMFNLALVDGDNMGFTIN